MKPLLVFLFCALSASTAFGERFRVYELLISREKLDAIIEGSAEPGWALNPADPPQLMPSNQGKAFIDAIGESGVQLLAYAEASEVEPGKWRAKQSYMLDYMEPGGQGKPAKKASRPVGVIFEVTAQDGDVYDYHYQHSSLETWVPSPNDRRQLLPIIDTVEIRGEIIIDESVLMGGLVKDDSILHIVFEKVE